MDWNILNLLSNIYFEEPNRLQFLSIVPVLFLFWLIAWGLRLYFRPPKTHGSKYPLVGSLKFWLAIVLMLPFVIGARAKPFTTKGNVLVKRGAAEVIFVVDYSSSMFLKDTGWARIDIARREVLKLLSMGILQEGDKASLFLLQVAGFPPRLYLTGDLSAFSNEVSRLGRPVTLRSSANYWGSDVSGTFEKLYMSIDRQDIFNESGVLDEPKQDWRPKFRKNRLVIVFTDGDFFNGQDASLAQANRLRLENALQELKTRGLRVYPVGIGTTNETKLTDILKDYEMHKDYDVALEKELAGKVSSLNPANLELLKSMTGGTGSFIIQNTSGDASGFIELAINNHRTASIEPGINQDKKDLWLFFLMTALTIFVSGLGRYYLVALSLIVLFWKLII